MTIMQAAVARDGGIKLMDVPRPIPKRGEVLVQIHAATINPTDVDVMNGKYAAMVNRARKHRPIVTGLELSGVVVSDGERFKHGDEVFGYVDLLKVGMTHAQYAAVPEAILAHKPASLSHIEAVTLPIGALTAYVALHQHGHIGAGSRILINGASGGVGTYALQLGKLADAHLTTVCSARSLEWVRRFGAHETRDYRDVPVLRRGDKFDVIFDVANTLTFAQARPYLSERGTYIITDPFKDIWGLARGWFGRQRSPYLMVLNSATPDFLHLVDLTAQGKLQPVVGEVFSFQDIAAGFTCVASGHKSGGRVVVQMG